MPFRYIRMTQERFEHLLSLVGPRISKPNTTMREAISAAERLTLTLRYLAGLCNKLKLLQYVGEVWMTAFRFCNLNIPEESPAIFCCVFPCVLFRIIIFKFLA